MNATSLNILIKGKKCLNELKARPRYMLLPRTHINYKDTNGLKIKEEKWIYDPNLNKNKAILISEKEDFRTRNNTRKEKDHFVMIKC